MGTHASVVQALRAGTQRQRGVVRVVPRSPQPGAILGPGYPGESRPRVVAGQLLHALGLIADFPFVVAVKLEEERWQLRIVELREAVDRVHLHFVEELDTSDGNAELNCRDHRPDRIVDCRKAADRSGDCLGERLQPHRDLADDAERSFRADEQSRQVVTCR